MLLIALTGPVGSGKTHALAGLAAWAKDRGTPIDGFVARADGRVEGRGAADRYTLGWVATGESMLFAEWTGTRGADGVPYRFAPETSARVLAWAEALAGDSPGLVVLDEFGPAEAAGGGHAAAWPAIAAADPAVVVIAVRDGLVPDIEARLGRAFDVTVDAAAPDAAETLRALCVAQDDWARIGLFGAGAGGIEATVGAALHAGHVPLAGLGLSTTQAVVMAFAGDGLAHRPRVVWVPFVSAGLKALSPAGSRLRPMLAITVQGLLFSAVVRFLGWTRPALFVAGALVGMWAAAQGLILQYLLVGENLLLAVEALATWVRAHGIGLPGLTAILAAWIAAWGLAAGSATAWAFRRTSVSARVDRALDRGAGTLPVPVHAASRREAIRGAARDLARPAFWLPVAFIVAVVVAVGSTWEAAFWTAARAATVGFLIFAAARSVDPVRAALWLRRRGHWGPAEALGRALGGRR